MIINCSKMNWQIQITKENREEFSKWYSEKSGKDIWIYTVGAWYGINDKGYTAIDNERGIYNSQKVSYEYFLQNIKNEKLDYVIF